MSCAKYVLLSISLNPQKSLESGYSSWVTEEVGRVAQLVNAWKSHTNFFMGSRQSDSGTHVFKHPRTYGHEKLQSLMRDPKDIPKNRKKE